MTQSGATGNHRSQSSDKTGSQTRKVAILITDMKGSTAFYQARGNLAGRIMIQKHNDILFPIIREHNGSIVNTMGDSIFAYFLSPPDALQASIRMQKKLEAHNQGAKPDDHLLIRIAINYGECIVEEKDVFGDAVDIVNKLVSFCDARQIIVTKSFYDQVLQSPDAVFKPYPLKDQSETLRNLSVYMLAWETPAVLDQVSHSLFSLGMEAKNVRGEVSDDLNRILPLVRGQAEQVVQTDENSINAVFKSPSICLETAVRVMESYLQLPSEGHELAYVLRIGLHSAEVKKSVDASEAVNYSESLAACAAAGPYEIVATSAFHTSLSSGDREPFIEKENADDPYTILYAYRADEPAEQTGMVVSVMPDQAINSREVACFYCGMTAHPMSKCPSKLIQEPANYLEKLGYSPLPNIRKIFDDYLSEYVKPLGSGADEERYDRLFNQERENPFAIGFFSLYETSEIFQLRSLQQLYQQNQPKAGSGAGTAGALLLGRDCLRVARSDEADEWFDRAVKENPNDYRPYIDMGILSMERFDPARAVSYFRRAHSYAVDDGQRCHIALLIARAYEISGALSNAMEDVKKILVISPSWAAAQYYYAVLLARQGKSGGAIDIFKKLLSTSERYYLMIALDPALQGIRKEINIFLNRELEQIRSRGLERFESIRTLFAEFTKWFTPDDEEYKAANSIYQKASQMAKDESISGLMDITSLDTDLDMLFRRVVERRRRDAGERTAAFKKMIDSYSTYLERYPYPKAVTPRDTKLRDDAHTLLENTRKAIDTISLEKLKESQTLIDRLAEATREIAAGRRNLDVLKNLYFSVEFSLKLVGCFLLTGSLAAFIFTLLLSSYQVFQSSASFTIADFMQYGRYGIIVGFISGLLGAAIWFKKRFREMYRKIEC